MNQAPEILRTAERIMFELEQAVCAFPRKHRYQLGADLREDAIQAALLARQACLAVRDKPRQGDLVQRLSDRVDQLKLRLQLAQQLQAFSSWGRFNELAVLVRSLGKQCGAWHRAIREHLTGQSLAAPARPERPSTLSSRAASRPEART